MKSIQDGDHPIAGFSESMTRLTSNPKSDPPSAYRPGPHWIAVFAAVFTLPLLLVGGSVTTYRVGLAVPDWPTTFGINMFLYDFWNAPFGVRVEHTHRLYGAAVGLATVGLCVWFLMFESRRWMKALGVVALVVVIVQGILGGTRVTQVSTLLAALHGCLGQAFFALMVALAVTTGRDWLRAERPTTDVGRFRLHTALNLGLIYGQVAIGASVRHFGGLSPALVHGGLALAIWVSTAVFLHRVRLASAPPSVVRAAWAQVVIASLQIILGVASFITLLPFDGYPRAVGFYQAVVRTSHQTNGAVLLAASLVLTLRAFRRLGPSTSGEPASSPSSPSAQVPLEVLA
ncbi:MAG: COX15/CtaA family protein [Paludisphaera borealis]|uniref:COX15/CtaA family protein n=1 Tax=Paludisphaera borealis TaxID=1387353 RepID=UPI0028450D86|nr:COX15/CtaA family protein [Paludisphaera borealis]MDR3621382.1 COX15/CtaA family protein [Paludisphaera borealis]